MSNFDVEMPFTDITKNYADQQYPVIMIPYPVGILLLQCHILT